MTVPPVNSSDRFRPLVARKNTAARNVISEITLNTSACRMNGIVRRILKNSISSLPRGVAYREMRDAAAMAVCQVDDRARHDHRREHRRQDAEAVHYGEAAHRARHHQQRDADDE